MLISKYQKEEEKANPFKSLGNSLIKKVKDLYAENYKTLIKEIQGDSKKWKAITCF